MSRVPSRWRPKILFVGYQPGTRGKFNIYVMNADGSRQRVLAERGHDPHWSSDGENISFVSNRDGDLEIYVMNAAGSGLVNVSKNPLREDQGSAWSPAPSEVAPVAPNPALPQLAPSDRLAPVRTTTTSPGSTFGAGCSSSPRSSPDVS